jgi:hypothetical protein
MIKEAVTACGAGSDRRGSIMSGSPRAIRLIFAAATVACATVLSGAGAMAQSHAALDARALAASGWWSKANETAPVAALDSLSGPRIFGWGFNVPDAVSSDGTHVWVANYFGNSVTELNAATGGLVKVIKGPSYGFDRPTSISSDGVDVWVANYAGNTVTGFPA